MLLGAVAGFDPRDPASVAAPVPDFLAACDAPVEGMRIAWSPTLGYASPAREVLDLIRGKHVAEADEILQFVERDIAIIVRKALASAVANAANNDAQDPEALYVTACYADEGPTLKRWRPRARGRATRIRKRTCHITLLVSRLPDRELQERRARRAQGVVGDRRRRRTGGGETATAQRGRPTRRPVEERASTPEPETPVEPDVAEAEMEALAEPDDTTTTTDATAEEQETTTESEEESK